MQYSPLNIIVPDPFLNRDEFVLSGRPPTKDAIAAQKHLYSPSHLTAIYLTLFLRKMRARNVILSLRLMQRMKTKKTKTTIFSFSSGAHFS